MKGWRDRTTIYITGANKRMCVTVENASIMMLGRVLATSSFIFRTVLPEKLIVK